VAESEKEIERMPTYDYECDKCKHRFEKVQKMSDNPLKKCPECGGKVRRMVSVGSGVIFKGKGFYQTDYKKSCPTANKKSEVKPPSCDGCPCGG
jgi:putative FmdB family regulatory protein